MIIDSIIVLVVLIVAIIGFLRGLVRSLNGVLGIAVALWGSLFLLPIAYPLATVYLGTSFWSVVGLGVLLFFGILLVCFFVGDWIVHLIHATPLRFLDRFLGLCLGIIKGGLFFLLIYWGVLFLVPHFPQQPGTESSLLLPWLGTGVEHIKTDLQPWLEQQEFMGFLRQQFDFLDASVQRAQETTMALYQQPPKVIPSHST